MSNGRNILFSYFWTPGHEDVTISNVISTHALIVDRGLLTWLKLCKTRLHGLSAGCLQVEQVVKEFGGLLGWFMKTRSLMYGTPTMMNLLRWESSRISRVNMRILDYRLVMMAVERWEDMRGEGERWGNKCIRCSGGVVALTPEATMVPWDLCHQ